MQRFRSQRAASNTGGKKREGPFESEPEHSKKSRLNPFQRFRDALKHPGKSIEAKFRRIASKNRRVPACSVLSPNIAYFVTERSELQEPRFQKSLRKAHTLCHYNNVDIKQLLDALVEQAELDDLGSLPFVILDVDLLGAFARAMILQAKFPSAKLIIGVADVTMFGEDTCIAVISIRRSLGLDTSERNDTRALAWGSIPAEAVKSTILWSKIVEMKIAQWFPYLEMTICNAPSTLQAWRAREAWLRSPGKFWNPDMTSSGILLGLYKMFGLDANEEVSKQIAATLRAWSYALLSPDRHGDRPVRDELDREFEGLLQVQYALTQQVAGFAGASASVPVCAAVYRHTWTRSWIYSGPFTLFEHRSKKLWIFILRGVQVPVVIVKSRRLSSMIAGIPDSWKGL